MERRGIKLPNDLEPLVALQKESWRINFPDLSFDEQIFKDVLERALRKELIYIYTEKEQIIAWLWLDLTQTVRTGHIRHLQVVRTHWGRGLGKRLLSDAIEISRERGKRWLTLNVTKSNERAMALYVHAGFQVVTDYGDRQFMRLALK